MFSIDRAVQSFHLDNKLEWLHCIKRMATYSHWHLHFPVLVKPTKKILFEMAISVYWLSLIWMQSCLCNTEADMYFAALLHHVGNSRAHPKPRHHSDSNKMCDIYLIIFYNRPIWSSRAPLMDIFSSMAPLAVNVLKLYTYPWILCLAQSEISFFQDCWDD